MIWLIIILVIIIIIVALVNYMSWGQYMVLFEPHRDMIWSPTVPYSNILVNVDGSGNTIEISNEANIKSVTCGQSYIHGWHFRNFRGAKTILFCHGNSGNISHRKYIIDTCYKLNINLLIFDYRGYGQSGDIPSKRNIRKDGEIMYNYLTQYCMPKDIVVWGESLGGHVATYIASKYPCKSLILFSTFSSITDIIGYSNKFKLFSSVINSFVPLLIDILPSRELIKKVKVPVFIIHSKNDTMIPYQCAMDMYDSIRHKNKYLEWIDGDHSSPKITDEQTKKLFMFMDHPIQQYRKDFKVQYMLDDLDYVVNTYLHKNDTDEDQGIDPISSLPISLVQTE
jgi:esterase/lipase